jgi:anti-sigma B factor antagonist
LSIQKWSNRIWLVNLNDDPAFTEDMDQLAEQALAPDRLPHLVLDLSAVETICSSNLSALLRLRKSVVDRDAQLRLTSPTDPVWAVFMTTGLDKVFKFTHDTPTALAELQIGA